MEHDEKKLEAFIDNLMSENGLEQPTLDFTDQVMSKIEGLSNSEATVYEPLISKSVWFVILGSFVVLAAYIYLKDPIAENTWLNNLEFNTTALNPFAKLASSSSTTLIYAFVFLALMVGIQVPLLKHYFNKRMSF